MTEKRNPLDISRDAPFTLKLSNIGDIVETFTFDGKIFFIGQKGVIELLLADAIDPAREHLETKGMTRLAFNIGMDDLLFSRTLGQAFLLTRSLPAEKKELILLACWDILPDLISLLSG